MSFLKRLFSKSEEVKNEEAATEAPPQEPKIPEMPPPPLDLETQKALELQKALEPEEKAIAGFSLKDLKEKALGLSWKKDLGPEMRARMLILMAWRASVLEDGAYLAESLCEKSEQVFQPKADMENQLVGIRKGLMDSYFSTALESYNHFPDERALDKFLEHADFFKKRYNKKGKTPDEAISQILLEVERKKSQLKEAEGRCMAESKKEFIGKFGEKLPHLCKQLEDNIKFAPTTPLWLMTALSAEEFFKEKEGEEQKEARDESSLLSENLKHLESILYEQKVNLSDSSKEVEFCQSLADVIGQISRSLYNLRDINWPENMSGFMRGRGIVDMYRIISSMVEEKIKKDKFEIDVPQVGVDFQPDIMRATNPNSPCKWVERVHSWGVRGPSQYHPDKKYALILGDVEVK